MEYTTEWVEIVRCKNCIHGRYAPDTVSEIICSLDDGTDPMWQENDFCSYGERRETEA